MTDKRKAFEEKLDAQMKEWNAQIVLLKAKADTAKAEAKVEYYVTIEALQPKRDRPNAPSVIIPNISNILCQLLS